jgi:cell division protease FtsH
MVERNVFRRQVIAFGKPHLGHAGVGPVVFHRRPELVRDQLVLPAEAPELVERQVLGIARHRERLRASGQHVKRGLLLYGPPGNGKTLTVRYILGQALDHTVMLLTGGSLHLLRPACALARMLSPAIVVLEDVDLVAEERTMVGHASNPVLFDLLNELDGIEGDADVALTLTTNRADLLDPALAARPGRVDLAVGIGVPATTPAGACSPSTPAAWTCEPRTWSRSSPSPRASARPSSRSSSARRPSSPRRAGSRHRHASGRQALTLTPRPRSPHR